MKTNQTVLNSHWSDEWGKALGQLKAGQFQFAARSFAKLARHGVRPAEAWIHAAGCHERLGQASQALTCYLSACDRATPLALRLFVAARLGRLGKPEEGLKLLSAVNPAILSDEQCQQIASLYQELGAAPAAIPVLRQGLEKFPQSARIAGALGMCLLRTGALGEADAVFAGILDGLPADSFARMGRGIVSLQQGDCGRAEFWLDALYQEGERNPVVIANLVQAMLGRGGVEAALSMIEAELAKTPEDSLLRAQHVRTLVAAGTLDRADDALNVLRQRDPAMAESLFMDAARNDVRPSDAYSVDVRSVAALYAGWNVTQLERCQWAQYAAFISRIEALVRDAMARGEQPPLAAHTALFLPLPVSLRNDIARSRAEAVARTIRGISSPYTHYAPRGEKLRIGYASGDIRDHATAHLIRSLFRVHDRNRVEVFVYALAPTDESEYASQIKRDCDTFVDLSRLTNSQAARQIHDDEVQILVDLHGHTRFARLEIFALTPAPVQVSWLGFPGTVGAEYVPFALVDRTTVPRGREDQFTETLVDLPDTYQVNDRWQPLAGEGVTRIQAGLPEDGFVFCCFNQPNKIEPEVFSCWMNILRQVPDSILWLFQSNDFMVYNLRQAAADQGVDPQRLVFATRKPKAEHLERLALADLFLDTFVVNAHTTASDALWAGVPLLTLSGQDFVSRVAASLLTAMGLESMVTTTPTDYVNRAVELARDADRIAMLRQILADRRLSSPLFDTARFARHLEDAYDLMWEARQEGSLPRRITVAPRP